MNLNDKLQLLTDRIDRMIAHIRQLEGENTSLRGENEQLRHELTDVRAECHRLKLDQADRAQIVTSRLATVLERLDELEQVEG